MELTNNAKATIVFAAVLAVLGAYDMASGMANPDWGATRPISSRMPVLSLGV